MLPKLPLLNLLAMLFALFVVVGVTAQQYNSENHAKAQTVITPTFTCLGGCTQETANIHPKPAKPGKPTVSIPPTGTAQTSPTLTPSLSPSASSTPQPCSNTALVSHQLSSSPRTVQTQVNKTSSKQARGGFLKSFFQLLLAFIKLILELLGNGGKTSPCSPTPTIVPSATPSISGTASNFSYLGGYITTSKSKPTSGSLSAKWKVPHITDCAALQSSEGQFLPVASIWIGYQVNGKFTKVGTKADCSQGQEVDKAFTEQLPDPSTLYPDNPIAPGDQVTANVIYEGAQKFTVTMSDTTKGWTLSKPIKWGTGFDFASAQGDVVIENTGDYNASQTTPPLPEMPLPHFSPAITFTNVMFSENGQPAQPLTQTIAPGLKLSNNVNREGVKLSDTSTITNGSFTVTWLHN